MAKFAVGDIVRPTNGWETHWGQMRIFLRVVDIIHSQFSTGYWYRVEWLTPHPSKERIGILLEWGENNLVAATPFESLVYETRDDDVES